MEIRKPFDIADVKAGINAGRLYVQIKDGLLMLGDYQTGEVVRLSDIEMEPVVHARWIRDESPFGLKRKCSACHNCDNPGTAVKGHYCWFCGAFMDGEAHDDSGQ